MVKTEEPRKERMKTKELVTNEGGWNKENERRKKKRNGRKRYGEIMTVSIDTKVMSKTEWSAFVKVSPQLFTFK